jgi:beta-lactamase class A
MAKPRYLIIILVSVSLLSFFGYFLFSEASSYAAAYKTFQRLEYKVKRLAKIFQGECSFVIKDIKKPFLEISYSENEVFPAASLIKLPLAAVAFKAVKENKISLSQKVIVKRKDIVGGSGVLKTLKTPLQLRFKDIIELMLARSDNTATNKIIDLLGYDYINKSFKALGLKYTLLKRKMMDFSQRSNGVENYTAASDIVYLLEKIYNKQLIDRAYSELILSFLKKQKIKDRIPRYLPKGVIVAHKTGLERGIVHDAGIVFSPKDDYIICVLTKKVKVYSKAKKFIAQLSLLTYKNLYR